MTIRKFAVALALLTTCTNVFADGNMGSFARKRQITPMTAVYAGMTLSELGSGVVVFADTPDALANVSITAGDEPESVGSATSEHANVIVLKILRNLKPMLWVCEATCSSSTVFDEKVLELALTRYDDQRVEGTIRAVDKRKGMTAYLAFALDLHNVAEARERQGPQYAHDPVGPPLPALLATPEKPDAPSALYSDGKAIGLTDVYAFSAQDEFNRDAKNKARTVLIFTDGKMDKVALAQAENVLHAVNDQNAAGKFSHMLILRLLADGRTFIDLRGDEPRYAAMGDDTEVLQIRRNDAKRVEGSYLCKDDKEKRLEGHLCWDLHFALDVVHGR